MKHSLLHSRILVAEMSFTALVSGQLEVLATSGHSSSWEHFARIPEGKD